MVQTRRQARSATPDPKSVGITPSPESTKSSEPEETKEAINKHIKKPDFGEKPRRKTSLSDEEDDVKFGVIDLLRLIGGVLLFSMVVSYFVNGDSFVFGQEKIFKRYVKKVKGIWHTPIYMDEATLSLYNGTDPSLPIYLSINGTIFDVTEGRSKYGPGGGYSFFAGRDASRAYITGNFKDDLTWDLSGLEEEKVQQSLGHWVQFFHNHETYTFVGYLQHGPAIQDTPRQAPDEL